jgi:hypothetical protein
MASTRSDATRSSNDDSPTTTRERTLSMAGGVLGLVMFALGFLRWLSVGEGDDQHKFSGFAFQMPTTVVIGFSLAAGVIAILGATERRRGRGVPSAIPTGLAATSLLLAIGIYLGKGAISPTLGDQVGVEPGLVLAIVVSAIQTIIFAMGLSSRHDDSDHTRSDR